MIVRPVTNRWLQARLTDERQARVQSGDVTREHSPLSIPDTLALTQRFLGLPYTWGGTSSFGYDCSGFTQMLYRRRGISLPRDAQPQADRHGSQAVSDRAGLAAGDLAYFGQSDRMVTHTGMYLDEGRFNRASTSENPVVQVSPIDNWLNKLVDMRRPK